MNQNVISRLQYTEANKSITNIRTALAGLTDLTDQDIGASLGKVESFRNLIKEAEAANKSIIELGKN